MKKELTLQDYLFLIYRRKWVLIYSVIGVMTATILYLAFKPPVYKASTTFMLETRQIGFDDKIGMSFTDQTRPLGYYEAVMKSRDFRSRLYQMISGDSSLKTLMKDGGSREELSNLIRSGIQLSESEYTDFIQLSATAGQARLAFALARHGTELLKIRCMEIDGEELQNAVEFIDNQIRVSKQSLEQAEQALQEFSRKTGFVISRDEDGGVMNEIMRYENELTQIQSDIEMTRSNLYAYKRQMRNITGRSDEVDLYKDMPEVAAARERIEALEKQKLQIRNNPDRVLQLDRQIEQERQNLVQMIVSSGGESPAMTGDQSVMLKSLQENMVEQELVLSRLQNKERHFKRQINDFKKNNPNLMQDALEYMQLKRSKSVAENLYAFLLEKGEEARIKSATGSGGLRIIDNPVLPKNPIPVNYPRNLFLALILGLGFGFGIALIQEYLDHTVQTRDDITLGGDITLLGTIPTIEELRNDSMQSQVMARFGKSKPSRYPENRAFLIHQLNPKSPAVEAYRTLRANLEFTAVDEPIREVLITSPNPSEGKSITSANIAIAYALMGQRVCLVDADLRKPKQHTVFKTHSKPGIVDHLVGGVALPKIVKKTAVPNLFLIPCGKIPPNPTELISSKKMTTFIQELRKPFDIVIYDSAPLLTITDSMILSSRLQGMLLVFRHGQTHKEAVIRSAEVAKSARCKIFGTVLNNVPVTRGYGYGYYYHSYYSAKGYYNE